MTAKTFTCIFCLLASLVCGLRAQSGLKGEYFDGANFERFVFRRTDPNISFVWDNVAPAKGIDPHVFSIRWTGKLEAPETGLYTFRAHVDDGIRVWIDGRLVIDAWALHDSEKFSGQTYLTGGQQYQMKVEYFNAMFEGEIQLYWLTPSLRSAGRDRLIESQYLFTPGYGAAAAVAASPKKPQKAPVTVAAKPKPKPTVPKPAAVAKDTLEKYLPKNVLFVKSRSILLPESEPELDRLAGFLKRNPKFRLLVEGHTDRIGNAGKNLTLSRERAETVAGYLAGKGIDPARITARGYGDTRPLVVEAPNVPNEKNRRVEFTILE